MVLCENHSSHLPEICNVVHIFTEITTFFSFMSFYMEPLISPSHSELEAKKKSQLCSLHFPTLTLCLIYNVEFLEWVSLTVSPSPDLNVSSTFVSPHWLEAKLRKSGSDKMFF